VKQVIILGVAFLFAVSSSFACTCASPNFTPRNKTEAIESFMDRFHEIQGNKIIHITMTGSRPHLTFAQKAGLAAFSIIERNKDIRACATECEQTGNADEDYEIQYVKEATNCIINLRVLMTSSLTSDHFVSKITAMNDPFCE